MNPPVANSLLHSIFTWVWQTSLAASVLIGLVLLLQLLFHRLLPPRWRYALWLLVLLRLVMPATPATNFSLFNLVRVCDESPQNRHLENPVKSSLDSGGVQKVSSLATLSKSAAETDTHGLATGSASPWSPRLTLWTALPLFWLLGAAGCFLTALIQHYRLAARLKRERPIDDHRVNSLLQTAKADLGLHCSISAYATDCHSTPAVFGFFNPRLLLPRAMFSRFADEELRLVMLHELIHVQRRDVLLNWIVILVQSLHWFNPVIWFAVRRLQGDRELVCDAAVMSHLPVEDRRTYGRTLIKLLEQFSKPALSPTLAPIIHQQHQIEKRITMITQFKPTPRLTTLASAMLVGALGCFTLTRAADKNAGSTPAAPVATDATGQKPPGNHSSAQRKATQERTIQILEKELAVYDSQVAEQQKKLDDLRARLKISEMPAGITTTPLSEPEVANKLQTLLLEAQSDYAHLAMLYGLLTNMTRVDLKRSLPTVSPDSQLVMLLENLSIYEQKLTEQSELYSLEHPEVRRVQKVIDRINTQINERIDGIMEGLKAQLAAKKAKVDYFQATLDKTREGEVKTAGDRRQYFQAKRELENLQLIIERLRLRLVQEKIDAAIAQP